MKATPHLLLAGTLIAVALFSTGSAILGGAGGFAVPTREQRIVGPATNTDVVPAERALDPVIRELADGPMYNPFSSRRNASPNTTRIPQPPPPPLEYPELPVMPIPQK